MSIKLPKPGMIFWPVGCGDSTTIAVSDGIVMQVDLNHMARSEDHEDPAIPVNNELEKLLPRKSGKPYLSVFALTHPDQDHCRGFKDFLKRVTIGELWFSPRVFTEYKKDLSEDALAFREEADRRVKQTIKNQGNTAAGDRVRVVGFDDILKDDKFKGFPTNKLSFPGHEVTEIDGQNLAGIFRAFIHAPFKDDCSGGDRNDTSLAFQIRLTSGKDVGNALIFGDLAYPTLKRIFEVTKDRTNLAWNVLLSPHHCSKSAMYWKDEGADDESLKQEILDNFESVRLSPNWIVASSICVPDENEVGDNPPHAIAKERYEEITESFQCTHEHVSDDNPHPIVFEVTAKGLTYMRPDGASPAKTDRVSAAVGLARGSNEPPRERVGFGKPH